MACVGGSNFFETIHHFPAVNNDKLNIVLFLEAASGLVSVVERLGKLFAPVRYDIKGNVDKIKNRYRYNEQSCLLSLMQDEVNKGELTGVEGVLWLNRALLLFELLFREIVRHLQSKNYNVNMKAIYTVAYEESVKKYHSWVTQKIFHIITNLSPSLPDVLKSFQVENQFQYQELEATLVKYTSTLHPVRSKIDDFFTQNNLFKQ